MSDEQSIGDFIDEEVPNKGDKSVTHVGGLTVEVENRGSINLEEFMKDEPTLEQMLLEMKMWAGDNRMYLELEGTVGFGRECVGFIRDGQYPEYANLRYDIEFDTEDYKKEIERYDQQRELFGPPNEVTDAYHKGDYLAVLGRGEDSIKQLYIWMKKLQDNNVTSDVRINEEAKESIAHALIQGTTIAYLKVKDGQ